jgi:hypothetical protein
MCRVRAEARQTVADAQSIRQEAAVIREDLSANMAAVVCDYAREVVADARRVRAEAAQARAAFAATRIAIEIRRGESIVSRQGAKCFFGQGETS